MLGIISLILEASSTDAYDTKKTIMIMYNALRNHPLLKGYWTVLIKEGLLTYDDTTQTFKTTEKGLRFLLVFSELDLRVREEQHKKNNPHHCNSK